MWGWKGVIEDGKGADWETFKWLCSSVQHGGRVAQAMEGNATEWLPLLTGGWQVSLCLSPPWICLSVHVHLWVCSPCTGLCALHRVSACPLACVYQAGWMCAWYGRQACDLRSSLLGASAKRRAFRNGRITALPPWQHLMEETGHLLMSTLI